MVKLRLGICIPAIGLHEMELGLIMMVVNSSQRLNVELLITVANIPSRFVVFSLCEPRHVKGFNLKDRAR